MTKRVEAKYKSNRRFGQNLWGRPKSPVNKRSYGPGQHGQRGIGDDRMIVAGGLGPLPTEAQLLDGCEPRLSRHPAIRLRRLETAVLACRPVSCRDDIRGGDIRA